jgi:CheY-like chemotaxis protein
MPDQPRRTTKVASVLLVEDDLLLRMSTADTLADLGYVVAEAPDAARALALLDQDKAIRALITDVGMPGMDGRALALEVRRRRPDVGILFVSGYAREKIADPGLPTEGIAYLAKPYRPEDIDRALQQLLR